jgi:DNA polymerase-3 subunit epsilon
MEFVALDVETANADSSSICQIGIARFEDGCLAEEWSTLVNPEDEFDSFNVSIHGITEDMVKGAPVFPELIAEIECRVRNRIVVMSRMKESHRKGVVTHPDPESCTVSREAGGEA